MGKGGGLEDGDNGPARPYGIRLGRPRRNRNVLEGGTMIRGVFTVLFYSKYRSISACSASGLALSVGEIGTHDEVSGGIDQQTSHPIGTQRRF